MGYFKKIKLKNFRNFKIYEGEFSKNCNIFYGENGLGKTNILESISLFGKGKGFRNDRIKNMIQVSEQKFINTCEFSSFNQAYKIQVVSEKYQNRYIKKTSLNEDFNRETLEYLNSLITFIIFFPDMERLFLTSPSYRRNFIDRFIFSKNKNYNTLINKYKKNINERNKLLLSKFYDEEWLKKLEEDISLSGIEIYKLRSLQIEMLQKHLNLLNKNKKLPFAINIKHLDEFYNNKLDTEFYKSSLESAREVDKFTGGAKYGPHRSDLMCYVTQDFSAEQLSTGEQKTIVLLLILAQCNYLVNECKLNPVILLDEICSHLDANNRSVLLKLSQEFDLQIFMTGTEKNLFSFLSTNANYYNITN